jgi:hypothetical protein
VIGKRQRQNANPIDSPFLNQSLDVQFQDEGNLLTHAAKLPLLSFVSALVVAIQKMPLAPG